MLAKGLYNLCLFMQTRKCIFQQSASLCGWRHKRFICLSHSHAVTPIMSLPPVMHITVKIERALLSKTFSWFIILCKMVVLDTSQCTSLGLYDLEVIQ